VLGSIARGVDGRDDADRRLVIAARPEALAGGGLGTATLALGYGIDDGRKAELRAAS